MNPNEKVIEIYSSKKKLFLLLLGGIAMSISSAWVSTLDPSDFSDLKSRIFETISKLIGINCLVILGSMGMLLFGICTVFILQQLLRNSLALIIREEGIIDCSGLLVSKNCFIEWIDVVAINEIEFRKQKFISFIMKDPQKYINEQKNFLRKVLMRSNLKTFGTVITISSNSLKCSHEEFKTILHLKFDKFAQRQAGF